MRLIILKVHQASYQMPSQNTKSHNSIYLNLFWLIMYLGFFNGNDSFIGKSQDRTQSVNPYSYLKSFPVENTHYRQTINIVGSVGEVEHPKTNY